MKLKELLNCNICPRNCNVNRFERPGYCGVSDKIKVAKAFLHRWEEPCISGENGSGTVFFSNCNLQCVFCQNHKISHEGYGKEIDVNRLSNIFLELQEKKAHNINLVTPTIYIPQIREALILSKSKGLIIPVIYNTSGYEKVESLKGLEGLIDVYLPDIKYYSDKYAVKYSHAREYFNIASQAILEMYRQVGGPVFKDGMIKRGLMIRHLMMPGMLFDSKKVVDWVLENLPEDVYLNIMCQYTPLNVKEKFTEIDKRVNRNHYETLIDYAIEHGLKNGFYQDIESAQEEYIPDFNLEGI